MILRPVLIAALLGISAVSAATPHHGGTQLSRAERAVVVDSIATTLNHMYVFPDIANRIDVDLHDRLQRGEFEDASDASIFAQRLTEDLQAISHDKHLRVGLLPPDQTSGVSGNSGVRSEIFGRSERMRGDVAYVEIRGFAARPDEVREETSRIMSAAADAKALIVDLRENGGGAPLTVALVSSYLFGDEPVHLTSLYFRQTGRTEDVLTNPFVAGKKFGPDKPIYILTSARTFSAGEEFAYSLQTRKRATVIGERTAGGANPGQGVLLPCDLSMFVPISREINPVTKTNWEGVGVKPDVEVSATDALEVADALAREAVKEQK
jgi:hypothetical protein